MHPMPTEGELVRRASAGDAQAFGELYERHLTRIYRYVFYKVGNAAEAEDLTEQVFIKAWEAIGRYRDQGVPFAAWLFRLAHNQVIDYQRTRKETAILDEIMESTGPSPDDVAAARLGIQDLRCALAKLTPEQQQVVILRFVHGMSHAEVATIMGKNEGAVRALQHRALQALHELLADRLEL
jgi:RNA polymerase sigma-70 factor (ECF subfamily)